jgi:hypothetical protein
LIFFNVIGIGARALAYDPRDNHQLTDIFDDSELANSLSKHVVNEAQYGGLILVENLF